MKQKPLIMIHKNDLKIKLRKEVRAEAKRNQNKMKEYKTKQNKRYKDYQEEIGAKKNQSA